MRADVDIDCLDETGHLRMEIHVLERLERPRNRQRVFNSAALHRRDRCDHLAGPTRGRIAIVSLCVGMAKPLPARYKRDERYNKTQNDLRFSCHTCSLINLSRSHLPV